MTPADTTTPPWKLLAEALANWEEHGWGSEYLRGVLKDGVVPELTAEGVEEVSRRQAPGGASGFGSGRRWSSEEEEWVQDLLIKGLAEEVDGPVPSRVADVFPLSQKGKVRWITNLKFTANRWTRAPRFKAMTTEEIAQIIRRGDWGAVVDIRSAFQHMRIRKEWRWLFAFRAAGRILQPTVLQFGWLGSPYWWSRVMAVVKARAQAEGLPVRLAIYVDDILILGRSQEATRLGLRLLLEMLQEMGLKVATEKVSPVGQVVTYVGYVLDLAANRWSLAPEVRREIRRCAAQILRAKFVKRKSILRLLGKVQGRRMALPGRNAMTGRLYSWLRGTTGRRSVGVPQYVHHELQYWARLKAWQAVVTHPSDEAAVTADTDASKRGWGAVLRTHDAFYEWCGRWPQWLARRHITELEARVLLKVLEAMKVLGIRRTVLRWRSDNIAALSMGTKLRSRSPRLDWVARRVARWLRELEVTLKTAYIPGHLNVRADWWSREGLALLKDFRVRRDVFSALNRARPHSIDAWATRESTHLPLFFSPVPDPRAAGWDALCERWSGRGALWMVPPWDLIRVTLNKVAKEQAPATIIVPRWYTASWYQLAWEIAEEVWVLPPCPLYFHPRTNALLPASRWSTLILFIGLTSSDWPRRRAETTRELFGRLARQPSVWVKDQAVWTQLS